MDKLRESDLYAPVRDYLEGLGYEVRGEVRGCDIAAVRDGELIVVELKTGFTLELIYQALDRQRIADGVYVAVPLPKRGYMAPQIKDMQSLCRRLELGLIFVGFTSKGAPQPQGGRQAPDQQEAPPGGPPGARGPHRERQYRRRHPHEDPYRL